MTKPFVTVVMPVRNEESHIRECIESLLLQDYPFECMEWFFVDGLSTDDTREILEDYSLRYPDLITVLSNPEKTAPCAMNVGIDRAKGSYIVRLDAHAEYASDYISKCVSYLESTDADNVGGLLETRGRGFLGSTIALMLSSKFGVGGSRFRTGAKSGYVDTVPFGAFRREVFKKWGGYDERLVRNQDYELNYRIRKGGGKVYLADDIHLVYYCRNTILGITKNAFDNGKWNLITTRLCPGSMSTRHFVPLIFVLSLVVLGVLSPFVLLARYFLLGELALYFVLDAVFSAKAARGCPSFFALLALFPLFHVSYGVGSMAGLAAAWTVR